MPDGKREREVAGMLLVVIVVLVLSACGQRATTGPGEIHWDRQTCEHCQMVISDRRYAAQLRMPGDRTTKAFDDLGCALLWLDEQGLIPREEARVEVWVRDPSGKAWVDGRKARFAGDFPTPMNYGFATADQGIPLSEVRARIASAEKRRRSGGSGGAAPAGSGSGAGFPGSPADG